MSHFIQFDHVIPFRWVESMKAFGPALFVSLLGPGGEQDALVILDTGAEYSLFDGSRATALGLNLLDGRKIKLASLGGSLEGYVHPIDLEIEGFRFQTEVVFSTTTIPRELLGRHSLFRQTTWGLRESQQEIYFSPRA